MSEQTSSPRGYRKVREGVGMDERFDRAWHADDCASRHTADLSGYAVTSVL